MGQEGVEPTRGDTNKAAVAFTMPEKEASPTASGSSTNSEPVITAFRSFELRPLPIENTSWISSVQPTTSESKRVFRVYESNPDGFLGNESEVLRYYIDTDATFHIPVWPFNSSQTVSVFAVDMTPNHILNRRAVPLEIMQQSHQLGGRFMCSMGSIRERNGEPKDAEERDSEPERKSWVSSGLGHGEWSDERLEKMLGYKPAAKNNQRQLEWKATGADWYDSPAKSQWPGRGNVDGGGLILKGKGKVLALYKARSACWDNEKDEADGNGVGVLAICSKRIDDEMVRHILVSAVAIEEQIMRSKGFNPREYHAGWM